MRWEELSSTQLAAAVAADPALVALVPVGATEQHGPHLPVGTDTVIATAVADAAAGGDGAPAVVLPAIAYGASQFHGTELAGTVAFSGEDTAARAYQVARPAWTPECGASCSSTGMSATRLRCGWPATASAASIPRAGSVSCSGGI
jgi:creatinine amidohydrolase/Fe(II)-dependent formamide hydrolase-like protein